MAYKKTAYRKTENGFKSIHRDFFCKMSKVDQTIFRDTNKPFYLQPDKESPKLTYNIVNKTFSFYPEFKGRYYGSSEESATHKFCVEEISKLNSLSIKIGDRKNNEIIEFTFNYAFSEIYLKIGEDWIKPDILLFIRKPYHYALKWNRILAVEVIVSHDLNGEKLQIMKDAKIPIIRIIANKKWGRKKEKNMSQQEKEELKNWIKNSFKKVYSADLLLDSTKSKTYLENKVINDLKIENNILNKTVNEINSTNSVNTKKNQELLNDLNILKNKNSKINESLNKKIKLINDIKTENQKLSENNVKIKKRLNKLHKIGLLIIIVLLIIIYLK